MQTYNIFKAYDIRGKYPDELSDALARQIGYWAAEFLSAPGAERKMLVGRDMRVSSAALSNTLIAGLRANGCAVVDLGLISTDVIYYASGKLQLPGIMLTASHNPAQYGGLKFCRAGAVPVSESTGLRALQEKIEADAPTPEKPLGELTTLDILPDYADALRSFVDLTAMRPLKIVVDAGNGMAGKVAPAVFAPLPFQVVPLYFELDGTFPNHPANPLLPEGCRDAQAKVVAEKADLGIIFDGDADRAFFVDDTGRVVSSSLLCALLAKSILQKKPGAKILYNVVCAKIVPETIMHYGGEPVLERVGHSFIKERMRQEDIIFGGEHSGHYYFRDLYYADSGMLAALVVLELLSREQKPFSQLLAEFDRSAVIPETNVTVHDKAAVIAKLKAAALAAGAKVLQEFDGISLDFGDYWYNVRPSNTEPLLRLNLEASTRELCDAKTKEVLEQIKTFAAP